MGDIPKMEGEIKSACLDWLESYSKVKGFPVLLSICIVTFNLVCQFLFLKLSRFEGHEFVTMQLGSRILKIFVVQFINTALIILVTNIYITDEFVGSKG